jgi:nicotinamidase-related amidase
MTQLTFDPARTAVLCMDYQNGILSRFAQDQELLPRAASVLKHARTAGLPVIYVQVGFRPNFPEIGTRNALLNTLRNSPQFQQLFTGTGSAIHSAVAPEEKDIVITKHRISAFAGTDLEMILRAKEIDTLILFGIATSGVVLSTLRHAADADYRILVLKDCCGDADPEVHACLMDKVFPRQAAIVSSADFLNASAAPKPSF